MASFRKRSRQELPSLDTLLEEAEQAEKSFADLKSGFQAVASTRVTDFGLHKLQNLGEKEKVCWLFATYPASTVATLCATLSSIKGGTTELQRSQILGQHSGLSPAEATSLGDFIESECASLVGLFAPQPGAKEVLTPPVNSCYECQGKLVANHRCRVKFYSPTGVTLAEKITLRCTACNLFYNYAQYGNKRARGFRYYAVERAAVEVSDTMYFDRSLLEFQCSLANHAWVSFQGFAESYNDTFKLPRDLELTPKIVAEAFYNGEVESELRRIKRIEYVFRNDSDREVCMEMIEEARRQNIYPHPPSECTEECKLRGCGRLWVTDGIWKTMFPHCMFRVENCVAQIPNLNLPDVCTSAPLHGKAFCREHCQLLETQAPEVPTGLRDFLKYCGASQSEEEDHSDADKVDAVIEKVKLQGNAGQSAADSQGTATLIQEHPSLVLESTSTEQLCRKDTGLGKRLRKWSRGHQFVVRGGGHIDTWQPLYRSESPSQVFLIVLQWLLALLKCSQSIPKITLAYDNICNLARLKVAQKPLPLPPPLDMAWRNVEKIIDVFHFGNYVSPDCKRNFCPDKLKKENPNFNTQAGEQTFVWVGRFKHILCSMNKSHHLFYLHRMVFRRNLYTAKCYRNGRKPILPKSKSI